MDYNETLNYLYAKLPMFSRIGAAALKPSLHNTIQLCEALNNPQNNFKTIHIAGTNGKGSTSHQLASILQAKGYKVGLYTSPHLKDFRERIKLNGEMCSKEFVVDFVHKIQNLIEDLQPSFFEVTVAMAFEFFALQQVDIAIIEVGMGGRLDSTNIITPVLSIITNIGFDHVQFLGNTYPLIANEKAGIIKPNVPVVIGEYNAETKPVFIDVANKNQSLIYFAQDNWIVNFTNDNNNTQNFTVVSDVNKKTYQIQLDLLGFYQQKNIKQVLEACIQLNKIGFKVDDESIVYGLKNCKKLTGLWGRWDVLQQQPKLVVDVAHNQDGINQVLHQLSKMQYQSLHLVMGMVKDKDVEKVLQLLPQNANYYFTNAAIERALPAADLLSMAQKYNLNGNTFFNVDEAIQNALQNASKEDLIVVFGSIFLVSEITLYNYAANSN